MINSSIGNIYLIVDENTYFSLLLLDGIANRIPELEEIKTIKHTEYEFEKKTNIEIFMPTNRKELKRFVEIFHPSLCWCAWWENKYARNNFRKLHGLPMIRKWSRRK